MDVNPNIDPNMSDEEKKEVFVERLWSLYTWMIDEYDIYRDVISDGMKRFNQELCDLWNKEDSEEDDEEDDE